MAQPDEPEWIKRVKSEGAVPLLDPENCSNGWASPSGDIFMVRGAEYFSNKTKIPGGEYLLKPLGFDWIRGPSKLSDLLHNPKHRITKALQEEFPSGVKPFVWAINLQVPSKENYSVVAYFVAMEPIPEGSLMDQFMKGDLEFKNSRLKLVANIFKGPWIVKKAVGEQAICVIGRALTCSYCLGENFIEVDIDIGSSVVANAVVHLAFSYLTKLTVDIAFLIEGQNESELPERILGAIRFSELNPDSASEVELPPQRRLERSQSSLARLWKKLGNSFSRLKGIQESSASSGTSGESHTNGVVDGEKSDETPAQESGASSGESHTNGVVIGEKSVEIPAQESGASSGESHSNGVVVGEKSVEIPVQESGANAGESHTNGVVDGEKSDEMPSQESGASSGESHSNGVINGEKSDEMPAQESGGSAGESHTNGVVNGEKSDEMPAQESGASSGESNTNGVVDGEKSDEMPTQESGASSGESHKSGVVDGEKSDEMAAQESGASAGESQTSGVVDGENNDKM